MGSRFLISGVQLGVMIGTLEDLEIADKFNYKKETLKLLKEIMENQKVGVSDKVLQADCLKIEQKKIFKWKEIEKCI